MKITAQEWLRIVGLCSSEQSVASIAAEAGVSYPNALKALGAIRMAIASTPESLTAPRIDPMEDMAV